ncbi:MAG: hypothetical protein U0835_25275 [Isosphaeraceae bacterium]
MRSVWVLIPRVGRPIDPEEKAGLLRAARGAGFDAVVDASDVYDGADPKDLAISPSDFHPNAEGHSRIARALDDALASFPPLLTLWEQGPERPKRDASLQRGGFARDGRRSAAADDGTETNTPTGGEPR